MSEQACNEPQCLETRQSAIDLVIEPRPRDLGGFEVRRVLPSSKKRLVGLATITYLFDGRILHRDSLGYVQAIEPGAVNWMTAGKGIVHSERTLEEDLPKERAMHGIQATMLSDRQREDTDRFGLRNQGFHSGRFPAVLYRRAAARRRALSGPRRA